MRDGAGGRVRIHSRTLTLSHVYLARRDTSEVRNKEGFGVGGLRFLTRVGSGGNKLRCEPTFCNSGMWKIELNLNTY